MIDRKLARRGLRLTDRGWWAIALTSVVLVAAVVAVATRGLVWVPAP